MITVNVFDVRPVGDAGSRHDLVDAVITPTTDDLLQITQRVEANGVFAVR